MPDLPNHTPAQAAWIEFVDSTRILLVPQPDDRPLDQYLAFRDSVLALVSSEPFLSEFDRAWTNTTPGITLTASTSAPPVGGAPAAAATPGAPLPLGVANALLLELQAFPKAIEVANTVAASESEKRGWFSKLLGRASTVAGSVDEILDQLPAYAKGGIKLFRELVDVFRGGK
jgi:hypothetical protein